MFGFCKLNHAEDECIQLSTMTSCPRNEFRRRKQWASNQIPCSSRWKKKLHHTQPITKMPYVQNMFFRKKCMFSIYRSECIWPNQHKTEIYSLQLSIMLTEFLIWTEFYTNKIVWHNNNCKKKIHPEPIRWRTCYQNNYNNLNRIKNNYFDSWLKQKSV